MNFNKDEYMPRLIDKKLDDYLKVFGWSYGLNMTDDLVIEAFKKAMANRGLSEDGIFHSDRGSQYTSNDFETMLSNLKIKHSYSKKGYPYDNASMESMSY